MILSTPNVKFSGVIGLPDFNWSIISENLVIGPSMIVKKKLLYKDKSKNECAGSIFLFDTSTRYEIFCSV